MPSDASPVDKDLDALRAALRPAGDAFRSALARTVEEVRTLLDAREVTPAEHAAGARASLGDFAAGRVDPARFSALLRKQLAVPASDAARIQAAFDVLQDINRRLPAVLEVRVPAGGSLRDEVAARWAEIGRAFGAAHVVAEVRAGSYDERAHAPLLEAYPFERWSAAERELAPALLVDVEGADCRAAALAEFLDGGARIVLRVAAPCAPAPLARLVAPHTYVRQATAPADLAELAKAEGPAVGALLPAGCARFVHRPGAGALEVEELPTERPRRVGWASAAQQQEELDLIAAHHGPAVAVGAAPAEDPAGRLATWLLRQARVDGVA